MEDLTLMQLFAKMDDHLAQQDAYLREAQATNRKIDEHLAQQDVSLQEIQANNTRQHAMLLDMAEVLKTTAAEVAEIHASASRVVAGAMHLLSNLINRLEGRS